MRCLGGCGTGGTWYCRDCEREHARLYQEVREVVSYMGEDPREAHLALTASAVLESFERIENTTSLGKAAVAARARELLLEVEDAFMFSPWCPLCKEHKLELICGDPLAVTCTGRCDFG